MELQNKATTWLLILGSFLAGLVCLLTGVAYYFVTQDAPDGNFKDLRATGMLPTGRHVNGAFLEALFSLFVQMSEGATYSVVPFINKKTTAQLEPALT